MTLFRAPSSLVAAALAGLLALAPFANAADSRYDREPAPGESPPLALPAALAPAIAGLDSTPADNPATQAGTSLGRLLFYDRKLSANGLVSCSSCHAQASGFDDPTRFSIGFQGRITRRSAMALANARFNPRGHYFRDERAPSLEAQVLQPFTDGIEMGLKPGELVDRVANRPWYGKHFAAAFGDATITEPRIANALAQFVRSINSFDARYDRAGSSDPLQDFPAFSKQENRGKFLFFASREQGGAGCAACHETDAFVLLEPRDNGLPALDDRLDAGIGETTGLAADAGKFRAASLRNIAVSAPYMHDGRFATLEAVIDHYASGIAAKPNLAPELRNPDGTPLRFDFSDKDKAALVAFLKTLTDETLITDPRYADPFRAGDRGAGDRGK